MGFFDSFTKAASKAYAYGKSAAKGASDAYGKGKDLYQQTKEKISSLPVIGAAASKLVAKLEDKAKQEIEKRTGMSVSDIDARAQQLSELANRL